MRCVVGYVTDASRVSEGLIDRLEYNSWVLAFIGGFNGYKNERSCLRLSFKRLIKGMISL
jgi:hypothetical protein